MLLAGGGRGERGVWGWAGLEHGHGVAVQLALDLIL